MSKGKTCKKEFFLLQRPLLGLSSLRKFYGLFLLFF